MKKLNFSQMEVLNGGQWIAGPGYGTPCQYEMSLTELSVMGTIASVLSGNWFFAAAGALTSLASIKSFNDCNGNQGTMATY